MKKKIIFLALGLLIFCGSQAQNLKVTYSDRIVPSSDIADQIENKEIAAMVMSQLQSQKSYHVLYYENGVSLYEALPEKAAEEKIPGSGMQGALKIRTTGRSIYRNMHDQKAVSQESIMGKTFLIDEDLKQPKWTLVDEEKEVNGYLCKKAIQELEKSTAWYCPAIPVNGGPSTFWGLPGLILQIEQENRTITAEEITSGEERYALKAPGKGKKITRKEFKQLLDKKMKEMGMKANEPGVKVRVIN
jgi:GLPGLI family protein